VSYGDVETEGLHEAIIEPALFYRANALKERKQRHRDDVELDTSGKGSSGSWPVP